jgi:hypothetical protein
MGAYQRANFIIWRVFGCGLQWSEDKREKAEKQKKKRRESSFIKLKITHALGLGYAGITALNRDHKINRERTKFAKKKQKQRKYHQKLIMKAEKVLFGGLKS